MFSHENNEHSHISILIRYINHLKTTARTVIRIKLWACFVLFWGRVEIWWACTHILITVSPSVASFSLLRHFSHFYFYGHGDLLPSNELDKTGRLTYVRECDSTLLGKQKAPVYCFGSKINKSIGRTQTVVAQRLKNPHWFRGLSKHRKSAPLSTYWLKSLGFCIR